MEGRDGKDVALTNRLEGRFTVSPLLATVHFCVLSAGGGAYCAIVEYFDNYLGKKITTYMLPLRSFSLFYMFP